ncbi:MAG: SGNH/GDSL hydrolase family protein [Bryobacteraceae bacterium]
MRFFAIVLALAAAALGQERPLLPNNQLLSHYDRAVQLMESTGTAVPGLARAGAPVIENARQSLVGLRSASNPQDAALNFDFITNVRAYLELADALPKPHPFPQEGRRQFAELRDSLERSQAHFRALLELKDAQLRAPDRDNLKRYSEQNSVLQPPQAPGTRVVFLGDSITDGWRLNEYFPGKDYVNRGISGQITGQMLGRMLADVVRAKPIAMVVLAGTNDIARGVTPEAIEDNLAMIADIAEAHKIKPVFASILPIHDYNKDQNPAWEMSKRRPMATIKAVNQWLQAFCQKRNFIYLDYFAAMVDEQGFLKKDLAQDGLHPNAAGYSIMAPLAQAAIEKSFPAGAPPAPERKRRFLFGGK